MYPTKSIKEGVVMSIDMRDLNVLLVGLNIWVCVLLVRIVAFDVVIGCIKLRIAR